jgi:hypothetical protein
VVRNLPVLLLLAGLAPRLAVADPVEVRVRLVPDRTVVHGQMLLLVEVFHPTWTRPRWEAPPFPGFWPERVSTQGEMTQPDGAMPLRRTVFRRALFPTRAGTLAIPASVLRYEEPDRTERMLSVPGLRAQVDALPEAAAPEEFGGLVGRVEVDVELLRNEIVLGESTRLLMDVYGEANVWDIDAPDLESALDADLEAFPVRPRLHVGEHEDRLSARRTFAWDLVPRRDGRLEIPAIPVAYFDREDGVYRVVRSEPMSLEVAAKPSAADSRSPFASQRERAPLGWSALPYGILWIGAVGLAGLFLVRWARRTRTLLRVPARPSPRAALAAAREGLGTEPFAGLLAHAVKAGMTKRHRVDVMGLTTEEIGTRVDDPEAVGLLAALDRIRFAGDTTPPETLLERVALYVAG